MVGRKNGERGQVLAFTAGIMAILLAFSFLVVDVGEAVYCRIVLQSALDAGAQMGAAVLADGLNALALANGILLALGIGAFFSGGQTLHFVRAVQWFQDRTAALAPYQAVGAALFTARKGGAEVAFPLNGLSGQVWPSLMVKRAYFLPWLFGRRFPLWMEDALRTSRGKPCGERFVRLGGQAKVVLSRLSRWIGRGKGEERTFWAAAEAGAWGYRILGRWIFWPLPEPRYKARLLPLSCKPAWLQ